MSTTHPRTATSLALAANSSPVLKTRTRGGSYVSTTSRAYFSTPTSYALNRSPFAIKTSPRPRTSLPTARVHFPETTSLESARARPDPSLTTSHASSGTTQSHPRGNTAPVVTYAHSMAPNSRPSSSRVAFAGPARDASSSTISNSHRRVAPPSSFARIAAALARAFSAYPSMTLAANAGCGVVARTSSADTRFALRSTRVFVVVARAPRATTSSAIARASSTGIIAIVRARRASHLSRVGVSASRVAFRRPAAVGRAARRDARRRARTRERCDARAADDGTRANRSIARSRDGRERRATRTTRTMRDGRWTTTTMDDDHVGRRPTTTRLTTTRRRRRQSAVADARCTPRRARWSAKTIETSTA